MLLKSVQKQNILSKLKAKYFSFQQSLINSKDQLTPLMGFLFDILYFVPTVCLLFHHYSFGIPLLQSFFSLFVLSDFHNHFDVGEILTLILASIFNIFFIIITIYNYNVQKSNSFSSRLHVFFLKGIIFFNVPFTQLQLSVLIKNYSHPAFVIFKVISAISLVFCTCLCALYLKFKIKPLRKDNNSWNFSNQYEFNRFFLNFFRTVVLVVDGVNFVFLLISAVLQYVVRIKITKYFQKQYLQQMKTCSCLVISTHIAFLIYYISDDSQLACKVLFSLWMIVLFLGVHSYYNQINKPLQFPLCSSTPYQFYDFYYKICQKFQDQMPMEYQSNEHFYFNTLKQHSRRCLSKQCPLLGVCLMKRNMLSQMEMFISQILKKHKYQSPTLEVLEELWKLERGKKFSFRKFQYNLQLETEYIISCVGLNEFNKKGQLQIHEFSDSSNSVLLNSVFYDSLLSILQNFSEFYSEILKSKPKIQIITRLGQKIRLKVQEIHVLYMDMLKKKAISFNAIELYIEFQHYFLRTNSLNYDLMKKIILIQKNINLEQIEQIYLPAICVYSQTGVIENINMQCVQYLKFTRFELKTKSINEVFIPQFKVDKYFGLNEQEIQNSLIFIKKKHNEYACGSLKINTKFINNRKFFIYIFEKKRKTEGANFVLINSKFQIVQMVTTEQYIKEKRHPEIMIRIIWKDIVEKYVKSYQRQLRLTKLIKIDLKEYDCILMCSLSKTLNEDFDVIGLKIMRNMKDPANQRRSVVMRSNHNFSGMVIKKFQFAYDLGDQIQPTLRGYRKDNERLATRTPIQLKNLDFFAKKIRSNLVNMTIIKNQNFAQGIKTYRLIDQQFYNIDLEDKEAYIEEFEGKKHRHNSHEKQGSRQRDMYIIALIISVSLVLTGLSVFLLYSLNSDMNDVEGDFVRLNQIDRFKVNFYRILAMYRDVASGLYESIGKNWTQDIMQSYNNIRENQNKMMFSNQKTLMTYRNINYTGNLNQLIEVILSDVFSLTKNFDDQLIQHIHDTSILEVSDLIQQQQTELSDNMLYKLSSFESLKNNVILGIAIGILFFYFLMIYLCVSLVGTLKSCLSDLMMISDAQARQGNQNSQKLIYAIDMIRKNFQIDFKNILFQRKRFRPRRKQKETIVGHNLKIVGFSGIIIFLVVNLSIILMFHLMLESNFSNFKLLKTHGQNIIGVYSNLCSQTNRIQHTGVVNFDRITELRKQLNYVEKSLTKLIFSEQTNDAIIQYFMEDSCQTIYSKGYSQNTENLNCYKATPGYQIQDPFTIGLILYFTRAHNNMIQNVSDTYAATGIYSSTFSKVFSQLSKKISDDGEKTISIFIFQAGIWCFILISINIIYCSSAICLSLYVKKKNQSVDKLIKFLNLRNDLKNKEKQRPKQNVTSAKSIDAPRTHPKRLSMLESNLE